MTRALAWANAWVASLIHVHGAPRSIMPLASTSTCCCTSADVSCTGGGPETSVGGSLEVAAAPSHVAPTACSAALMPSSTGTRVSSDAPLHLQRVKMEVLAANDTVRWDSRRHHTLTPNLSLPVVDGDGDEEEVLRQARGHRSRSFVTCARHLRAKSSSPRPATHPWEQPCELRERLGADP